MYYMFIFQLHYCKHKFFRNKCTNIYDAQRSNNKYDDYCRNVQMTAAMSFLSKNITNNCNNNKTDNPLRNNIPIYTTCIFIHIYIFIYMVFHLPIYICNILHLYTNTKH